MELLQYWKIVQKSLWIIVLFVLVGTSGAAVYTLNQPAQYESTATLLLNPSVPSALVPYVRTEVAANLADSYNELIRTRSFTEAVAKELPFKMSSGAISRALSTRLVQNTLFFKISGRMDSPERAQQLVSTVLKVFLSENQAQQEAAASQESGTIDDMRQRLQDKLDYLRAEIKRYQDDINELMLQPPSNERDSQLLQLRGQLVSLQQTETETIVAVSQIGEKSTTSTALVIDQPLPGGQLPNSLNSNLSLAFAVALMAGIGLAFLRDTLDYRIHSADQMVEVLGLPVMATLGKAGKSRNGRNKASKSRNGEAGNGAKMAQGHYSPKLVALIDPRSPESENFRVLRTNIQFSSIDKSIHDLIVTSPGQSEGKSFVAANLAIVMAQAGKRVILVDTDLRKPGLHELFGLPNTNGFTNLVLNYPTQLVGAVQTVPGVDNLAVVTSGPLPPNPSELLSSQQTAQVMAKLAQLADVVIYDTPPAGSVTDPVIVATRVDAVVLVVDAGHTHKSAALRTKIALQNVGVPVILPVLNRAKGGYMQGGFYLYHNYAQDHTLRDGQNGQREFTNGKAPTPVGSTHAKVRPGDGEE